MNRRLYVLVLILVSFLQPTYAQNFPMSIQQGNKEYLLRKEIDTLHLSVAPFTFSFQIKGQLLDKADYYHSVAAMTDFQAVQETAVGQKLDDITYFQPGTGLAGYQNKAYEELYIRPYAHFHIVLKKDNIRLDNVEMVDPKTQLMQGDWTVDSLFFKTNNDDYATYSLKDGIIPPNFWLVLFSDHNFNDQIDKGEFRKIYIQFRKQ